MTRMRVSSEKSRNRFICKKLHMSVCVLKKKLTIPAHTQSNCKAYQSLGQKVLIDKVDGSWRQPAEELQKAGTAVQPIGDISPRVSGVEIFRSGDVLSNVAVD